VSSEAAWVYTIEALKDGVTEKHFAVLGAAVEPSERAVALADVASQRQAVDADHLGVGAGGMSAADFG
jgi:hypothetical protein